MSETTSVEFGSETVTGDLYWEADFSDPEAFVSYSDAGEWQFLGDELRVDTTGDGGATCWYPEPFPEDVLIQYSARVPEFPRDSDVGDPDFNGRNLNCLFSATGNDGKPSSVLDRYEDPEMDSWNKYYRNYFLTITYKHTRMRKSPGKELRSEFLFGADYPDHTYDISILKRGGDIAATIDGRLIHDWVDDDPYGGGLCSLVTWSTDVTFERWAVYEPT